MREKFCDFPALYSSHAVLLVIRNVVALGAFADYEQGMVYRVEGVRLCDMAGSCLISTFPDFLLTSVNIYMFLKSKTPYCSIRQV